MKGRNVVSARGKGHRPVHRIRCIIKLIPAPTRYINGTWPAVYESACAAGRADDAVKGAAGPIQGDPAATATTIKGRIVTIAAISRIDKRYRQTALTLGANELQVVMVIFREARYGIIAAIIAAFGRVIAEVGISMMLGGNAKGFTRTMTTAMALEYDKGEFVLAVALGGVLMSMAFLINMLFHFFQGRGDQHAV